MKSVFLPLRFRWRTKLKTCRTSLHSVEHPLKFRKYPEKHSLRNRQSSTPFRVSIVPRGNFGGTAGFLRSELLVLPPTSAERSRDQKERSLNKFHGQILNSFKKQI